MFRALSHRTIGFMIGAFGKCRHMDAGRGAGWWSFNYKFRLWPAAMAFGDGAGFFLTLDGVFCDLVDRRRRICIPRMGLAAIVLATLVWTNVVTVWMILGFSLVTGCCMALAGPSYQAMTFDLVGREDLANAVALNSSQFQLSRVIGPVFAGLGFKFFGLAGCFYLNGLSFVAVVLALRMVRLEGPPKYGGSHSVKDSARSLAGSA